MPVSLVITNWGLGLCSCVSKPIFPCRKDITKTRARDKWASRPLALDMPRPAADNLGESNTWRVPNVRRASQNV